MPSIAIALLLLTQLAPQAGLPTVSTRSILFEQYDLDALTRASALPFTVRQASSYDRASKQPGQESWFANGDAGQFVRWEGKEAVLADFKGPGAMVRFWSANPAGTVRFYFDGETTPRIQASLQDLFAGKVAPFGPDVAYTAARGANLYFPVPYQKGLKVTVENPGSLYYQIQTREYGPESVVQTFDPAEPIPMVKVKTWSDVKPDRAFALNSAKETEIYSKSGQGSVTEWAVKLDSSLTGDSLADALRLTKLKIVTDGELSVLAPLGDFFGTAPGITPYFSAVLRVDEDGTLRCRFPMPFKNSIRIALQNDRAGSQTLKNLSGKVGVELGQRSWTKDSYIFRAEYHQDRRETRPMVDLPFLNVSGEGQFVGTVVSIANPVPAWWGEGDEKIYLNGESFPSTFGTGTEDYFGYAWCDPGRFSKPYHFQSRCDGPGNRGHTTVGRFQVMDRMPFQTGFRFDMELWHWASTEVDYARTVYWYSKPKGTGPSRDSMSQLTPVMRIEPIQPVKGALEGETMRVAALSGGKTEAQSGFWELSDGRQLWWTDPKVDDTLVLEFESPSDGTFTVLGHFCHARDYGIHTLSFEDGTSKTLDFFGELSWKKIELGRVRLRKGVNRLTVKCAGQNAKAEPRRMFGLDYLLLNPVVGTGPRTR